MATPEARDSDLAGRYSASTPSSSRKAQTVSHFLNDGGDGDHRSSSRMKLDGLVREVGTSSQPSELTFLGSQIAPADAPPAPRRNDVWREIVSGERRRACKEEVPDEEMITLEEFLVRAGATVKEEEDEEDEEDEEEEEEVEAKDVKLVQPLPPAPPARQLSCSMFLFEPKVEPSLVEFGNGVEVIGGGGGGLREKRGPPLLDPLDRAAQQRQRRMIKNRESAARSRERKQAYQVELELLALKLEEENERLSKEKAERTKERRKQLMERVVPTVKRPEPARVLRRVRSMQWLRAWELLYDRTRPSTARSLQLKLALARFRDKHEAEVFNV